MRILPRKGPEALARELEALQERRPEMLQNVGKYVLIQDKSIVGYFGSYGEAILEGYNRFGTEEFLVRLIKVGERPIRAL